MAPPNTNIHDYDDDENDDKNDDENDDDNDDENDDENENEVCVGDDDDEDEDGYDDEEEDKPMTTTILQRLAKYKYCYIFLIRSIDVDLLLPRC